MSLEVVTAASDGDLAEALACIHAAFAGYDGRLDPPSAAMRETVESLRGRLDGGAVLVARLGGRAAGAVCAWPEDDGTLYLDRLAVMPEARGRGVAAALVGAVEDIARRDGLPAVSLGVRLALTGNIAMFERLGYRETGRSAHPGYDRPTSARMEKRLG